jgi:hypothetical protein
MDVVELYMKKYHRPIEEKKIIRPDLKLFFSNLIPCVYYRGEARGPTSKTPQTIGRKKKIIRSEKSLAATLAGG